MGTSARRCTRSLTRLPPGQFFAKWLAEVKANQTHHKMLDKYTQLGADGRQVQAWQKLRDVSAAFAEEVRHALNGTGYGATMMKIGWHARLWDLTSGGTSFQVVDVAQVIGAGVGSFGVGRYYVLLAAPGLDHTDGDDVVAADAGVLDVKFELPTATASSTCTRRRGTRRNSSTMRQGPRRAARADVVHRPVGRLGAYQRLALRRAAALRLEGLLDLSQLRDYAEYAAFISQVAASTATSHARSSVGEVAPARSRRSSLQPSSASRARARRGAWRSRLLRPHHEQVQLDYACFSEYYKQTFLALELQAGGRGGAVAHEDAWEHGEL